MPMSMCTNTKYAAQQRCSSKTAAHSRAPRQANTHARGPDDQRSGVRCARIRCTQGGTSPPAAEGSADPAAAKAPSPAAPADGDGAAAAEGPSLTEQIQTKTSGALDSLQKAVEPAGDSKSADPEVNEFRSLVGEVFANMKESIATGTTQQEGGDVAPEAPAAADAAQSKSLASSPAEARRPGLVGKVRFCLVGSHGVSLWQHSFWWCSGCRCLCTSCTASPIRTWCVTTPPQQPEMYFMQNTR